MSTTFTLTTPVAVGSLANLVTISALRITSITFTSTPALAPIGTGELDVTLTDPVSGWQETISYQDATVLTFWASVVSIASSQSIGDTVARAVFAKLIADGKLPAGTVATAS
jgi:uncharacterized protein YfaP (DUF2135 family)